MSAVRPRVRHSEYVAFENASVGARHEFVDGEIIGMAGARPRHNLVVQNVARALGNGLAGGPCAVVSSDQRLFVESDEVSFYPDVLVVCGDWRMAAADRLAVTNPTVLVEVPSPSTEAYDREEKLPRYRSIPSVRDVLLLDPRTGRIEHHHRAAGGWEAGDGTVAGVPLTPDQAFAGIDRLPADDDA